jgi:hypothetical protein
MFPITGDSMLPVPEGAFVIAEYITDWHSIKPFTPCIVITQDDGIVFKMVTINGEENALLQSLNPIYNPYEVSLSDVLEIWQFRSMVSDHLPELEISTQQIASALQDIKKDILLIKPLLTKDNSA